MLKGTFEIGFTHYDDPPPDVIDDLEALRDAGRVPLRQPPRRLGRGRGRPDRRRRLLGRRRSWARRPCASPSSAPRSRRSPLPDIRHEPEVTETAVRFVQTTGGRTGLPAPAPGEPPAVRAVQGADGVDDARAHDPRRRHVRRSRCSARASSRATGSTTPTGSSTAKVGLADFKDWYRDAFGKHTPWGDETRRRSSPRWRPRSSASSRPRSCAAGASPRSARSRRARRSSSRATQGDDLFLVLDGVLSVVDRRRAASPSSAPARSSASGRCSRAATAPSTLAGGDRRAGSRWRRADQIDRDALVELAEGHARGELRRRGNVRRCADRDLERQLAEGAACPRRGVARVRAARRAVPPGDQARRRRVPALAFSGARLRLRAPRPRPVERRGDPVTRRHRRRHHRVRRRAPSTRTRATRGCSPPPAAACAS